MGHDKKKKLQEGLHTHKTSEGDGSATKCDKCNAFTKYKGICAICERSLEDDNYLMYIGEYKPYEQLL